MNLKIIVIDTETTGLPTSGPLETQPHMIELAWWLIEQNPDTGEVLLPPTRPQSLLVKPDGWIISAENMQIHGITNEMARNQGKPLMDVMVEFVLDATKCEAVLGYNVAFDSNMINLECQRLQIVGPINPLVHIDVMKLVAGYYNQGHRMKLFAAIERVLGIVGANCHRAAADVEYTARIFQKIYEPHPIELTGDPE